LWGGLGLQTEGGESTSEYQNNNEFKRGVVYYLKNKKIVGVLLWNLFDRVEDARRAIKLGREFDDLSVLKMDFYQLY
jgi:programmed cell death 8 (apoptosis-inducing factor)